MQAAAAAIEQHGKHWQEMPGTVMDGRWCSCSHTSWKCRRSNRRALQRTQTAGGQSLAHRPSWHAGPTTVCSRRLLRTLPRRYLTGHDCPDERHIGFRMLETLRPGSAEPNGAAAMLPARVQQSPSPCARGMKTARAMTKPI